MDKSIKTRSVVKDVKTLEKRVGVARSVKKVGGEAFDTAESTVSSKAPREKDGLTYAEAKTNQALGQGASVVSRGVANQTKGAIGRAAQTRKLSKDAAQTTSRKASQRAASSIKTAEGVTRTEQTGKGNIKVASKTIKTASRSSKATTKSTATAAQSAKGAASASKRVARNAGYAARAVTRSATNAARAVARGATAFTKMAIASAKSLTMAIAALGSTAVSVVLIVCLVGLIAVPAFGVFFMGGDMGDGNPTLREVISEINEEHTQKINEIKTSNPHDEVAMGGTKTPWKEVLAIYSVRVTTDPNNPMDAMTLDEKRQKLLKQVFWDMNVIDSRVEETEITEIVLEKDEEGNQVEKHTTAKKRILHITLSSKSSDDMARQYGFDSEQLSTLTQLLDKRYDSTWQSVLYGISRGSGDIVEVAAKQLGNVGGQPYWSWYGFSSRVEWCACFVSWCANECGYIESGVISKFSYCPTGVQWFKDAGLWQERGYVPQPGDIIFFDWGGDGISDHVGVVESCDGSVVKTIEGNSGDACRRNSYGINSASIIGFGTPLC